MAEDDKKEKKEEEEKPKTSRVTVEEISEESGDEKKESKDEASEKPDENKDEEKKEESEEKPLEKKVEEESKEESEDEEDKEKDKIILSKRALLVFLFTLAVVSLITGGILRFRSGVGSSTKETPTPTADAVPTPEPTPEELDLTTFSLQVLNGSGVAGRAGDVADLLEEAGFEGVDTANADAYDFSDTEVALKGSVSETVFEEIKSTLSEYTVVKGDPLEETSDYDAIITVGEKI